MPETADFSAVQLRDKAKVRGLATSGSKAELIVRLMDKDPTGRWMESDDEDVRRGTEGDRGELRNAENIECFGHETQSGAYEQELAVREKEFELSRRE